MSLRAKLDAFKAEFQSGGPPYNVPPSIIERPLHSMTIVDLKFHRGELYVAGVSNQEFSSTLRRIAYPFRGAAAATQVEIYHVAHGMFETRAPIRGVHIIPLGNE